MDVTEFAEQLLAELANLSEIVRVTSAIDGPTLRGQAHIRPDLFVQFFYNERTGTTAFALIHGKQRIWGVDYDRRSGWHLHPLQNPAEHKPIPLPSIAEIVEMFSQVLADLSTQ